MEIDKNKLYRDMSDVELVLRFFAFRHIEQYVGRLDSFLDNFLKTGNAYSDEVLKQYENLFNKNIDLADKLFGEYAFRQYKTIRSKNKWSEPTRTAYDPMMLALIDYTESDFDFKKNTQDERVEFLSKLYEDNTEKFDGKRQSKSEISERMEIIEEFLNNLKKGE